MAPTLSIRTFGCRLNQAESAALAARLSEVGFDLLGERDPSEACLVVTCAVTRAAERECLRWLRHLDRRRPRPLIALAGCLAQTDSLPSEDRRRVDLLVDQRRKWALPELLSHRMMPTPRQTLPFGDSAEGPMPRFPGVRAWLRIQDGCGFGCSYCIVPQARGAPQSRAFEAILAEARALIAGGYAELVLTGANIACYRDAGRGLGTLTTALLRLSGLGRLRMGSIEPGTIETEIIALMAVEPRLCRSLHLPLQSADATVLGAMRRRYTPDQYRETVRAALRQLPDLGLGADVITGFPGEDAAAFERTRSLIAALPFSNLHVFPYSERPGTAAANLPASVPVAVRKARAAELIVLGRAKRAAFARRFMGREIEVLIERGPPGRPLRGYTGEYIEAEIRGPDAPRAGSLTRAVVDSSQGERLIARTMPGNNRELCEFGELRSDYLTKFA